VPSDATSYRWRFEREGRNKLRLSAKFSVIIAHISHEYEGKGATSLFVFYYSPFWLKTLLQIQPIASYTLISVGYHLWWILLSYIHP
jgi:hypothetical protein